MGLPDVKIEYGNGAIGSAIASADGLLLLAVSGATGVDKTFVLGESYAINRMDDLSALGVTADNNGVLFRMISEFYAEAAEGTKVYVAGFGADTKMSDMLNTEKSNITRLLKGANGEIRGVIVSRQNPPAAGKKVKAGDDPTPTPALDADVEAAMLKGQGLGDWSESTLKAPIFVLVDGFGFTGDIEGLPDLTKTKYNRVGVVLGSATENSANQSIGLVAGRIAKVGVQRNIGRVQDGTMKALKMWLFNKTVETADVATVFDKGYITFRCYTGISGYYVADDPLAVDTQDDYRQLARRRVIDKAYRIAYAVLITKMLDEVPVNNDGTIIESYAAALEQIVLNAIALNMTAKGELSTDPTDDRDKGCKVTVDRTNNVLASSQINITLKVRPYGYAKFIDVELGFDVSKN